MLRRAHQLRFQGRWEAGYLLGGEMLPGMRLAKPLYVDDWADVARLLGWLKREKPDAIITPAADVIAGTLKSAGWRIPDDIGLALLACPAPGDPHSGVYQNGRLIGALAVDTLISQVERHERGLPGQATTLMVEGQWNEGGTLRSRLPGGEVPSSKRSSAK